jgi:hypothetical protein
MLIETVDDPESSSCNKIDIKADGEKEMNV